MTQSWIDFTRSVNIWRIKYTLSGARRTQRMRTARAGVRGALFRDVTAPRNGFIAEMSNVAVLWLIDSETGT
jgi:hypothetical protein